MGLVEKNLRTIGQVEGAVAKVLTLLIIGITLDNILSDGDSLAEGLGSSLSVTLGKEDSEVRDGVLNPYKGLLLLLVDKRAGNGSNVGEDGLKLDDDLLLVGKDGLEGLKDDLRVTSGGDLGDLAVNDLSDTGKGLDGSLSLSTGPGSAMLS
jgi:hypothetical protein